jgi:hypothetical protein
VIQLLADVNITGHVTRLVGLMQSDYWRELWDFLDIRLRSFAEVGLSISDSDEKVWRVSQERQLYLLTNNRNDDGPDSLEATIRAQNTETSLPVFPIADAVQLLRSRVYAERVVESLFDNLLRIDSLRGVGRIFLP